MTSPEDQDCRRATRRLPYPGTDRDVRPPRNQPGQLSAWPAEISRIADFVFCDTGGALARGPSLHADTSMFFRTKYGGLIGVNQIARMQGEDTAVARINVAGMTAFNHKIEEAPEEVRLSRTQLVNLLVTQFVRTTSRILSQGPPRRI